MKVEYLEAGEEWVEPLKRGKTIIEVICCDCGLAHDIEFRVKDGKLVMRWHENRRATAATRRKHA